MERRFRQVAALAATAFALLPSQRAGAWVAQKRLRGDVTSAFDVQPSMVETQWGTPYYSLSTKANEDGSLDYIFASVYDGAVAPPIDTSSENKCAAVGMTGRGTAPFQTLEGISSADQCQQACGTTMRCSNAVFNALHSTCELTEKLAGLSKDPSKAVVLPSCDSTCFKSGQKLNGNGDSLGNAPNPSICQARCQAEPNCKGFTWTRSTSVCMSYNNDSDLAADDDAVSGPRQSCSSNTRPSDYAGSCTMPEMSDTGVPSISITYQIYSYKQCQTLCLNHSKCNWLTYNDLDRICYLKPQRGTLGNGYKHGDMTGPRLCDSSCFQKNVELTGKPIATFEDTYNPYFCHYECTMDNRCRMWNWNSGSKKCFLHGAAEVFSGRLVEGAWSGIRGPCGDEKHYAGSDITIVLGEKNTCAAVGMKNGDADSRAFRKLEDIKSADDCQQACTTSGKCNIALFDAVTSTCEFLESLQGMKPAAGRALVLPNCASDCFSVGKGLRGESRSLGAAPNPNICQARCQSDTNCQGFTWKKSTLECMAHDNDSDLEANNDAVSGPRESCSPNTKPYDYAGSCIINGQTASDMVELATTCGVASLAKCRKMCMNRTECNWWTYNTSSHCCYEKPGRGMIRTVAADDTTAPRLCGSSCFQKNIELTGKAFATLNDFDNPHSCHNECSMNEKCQNWDWTKKNKKCVLYGPTEETVARLSEGSWSGIRGACDEDALYEIPAPPCSVKGMKYGNQPVSIADAATAVECQKLCQGSLRCEAFAFDVKKKKCHFHLAIAEGTKKKSSNFISGPKECSPSCYTNDQEYTGKAIAEYSSGFEEPEECQLRCQADSRCSHWTFYSERQVCKLMNTTTTGTSRGAVSGLKYCAGSCYLKGFHSPKPDYSWDIELSNVGNVQLCREKCTTEKRCTNFTYWDDKKCYLKDNASFINQEPNKRAITGWPHCSTCFRQGVGYRPDGEALLWSLETENAEECRQRCDLMENCTRFTYDAAEKLCSMLSGETEDVKGETLISGPANCIEDTSCMLQNIMIENGDNHREQAVKSAAECQALCQSDVRCKFFTVYDHRHCYLKSGAGKQQPLRNKKSNNWISGTKRCTTLEDRCVESNIDYAHNDISYAASTKDPDVCMAACRQEPACRLWLSDASKAQCWLKKIEGFKNRKTVEAKFIVGSRLGCPKCVRSGIAYIGKIISETDHPLAVCQLACEANAACKFFTHVSGKCKLMSSMERVEKSADSVSGPKQC